MEQSTWIIGQTNTGKSTAMMNAALSSLDEGFVYIDPIGRDIDTLLTRIPKQYRSDTLLFDLADTEHPIGFNILDGVKDKPRAASSIMDVFKSAWGYDDVSTPNLDQYLYATTAALLDVPGSTLLGIKYMLTRDDYREQIIKKTADPIVKDFWQNDFPALPERYRLDSIQSTLNKIFTLIADPRIRNIIGQPKNALDLNAHILLIRIPKDELGPSKTRFMGGLVLSALSQRENVFVDNCQYFQTSALRDMLDGTVCVANQYLSQLNRETRDALMGNARQKIAFRTGLKDSEELEGEFPVDQTSRFALHELHRYSARIVTPDGDERRRMPELQGRTYPASPRVIRDRARIHYANDREKVEAMIKRQWGL